MRLRPLLVLAVLVAGCDPSASLDLAEDAHERIFVAALERALQEIPEPPGEVVVHPYLKKTAEDWTPSPSGRRIDFLYADSATVRRAVEAVPSLRRCVPRDSPESVWCTEEPRLDVLVLTEPRIHGTSAQVLVVHVQAFEAIGRSMEYLISLDAEDGGWEVTDASVVGSAN